MTIYLHIKLNSGHKYHHAMHITKSTIKDLPSLTRHLRTELGPAVDSVKIKGKVPQWAQMIFL